MSILGCTKLNTSEIYTSLYSMDLNKSTVLLNSSDEKGCFVIESFIYEGLDYEVLIEITSIGYSNKSLKFVLNKQNQYSIELGNITLEKSKTNSLIIGICVNNGSNEIIEDVFVAYYPFSIISISHFKETVFYKSRSGKNGEFSIFIDDFNKNLSNGTVKFKKRGYEERKIYINFGNSSELDLGKIGLFKKT